MEHKDTKTLSFFTSLHFANYLILCDLVSLCLVNNHSFFCGFWGFFLQNRVMWIIII